MRLLTRDLLCVQAVQLVTDYLDDALSARQRRRLERHLRGCPNCTAYLNQIRTMIALAGFVEPETLPADARDDLIELYRRYHEE